MADARQQHSVTAQQRAASERRVADAQQSLRARERDANRSSFSSIPRSRDGSALTPDGQEGPWVDPLPWVYYDGTRRTENPYPEGSANPYRVLWTYSPRLTPDGQETK